MVYSILSHGKLPQTRADAGCVKLVSSSTVSRAGSVRYVSGNWSGAMACMRTLAAVCYSVLLAFGHASTPTPTRGRLSGISVGESECDRKKRG